MAWAVDQDAVFIIVLVMSWYPCSLKFKGWCAPTFTDVKFGLWWDVSEPPRQ